MPHSEKLQDTELWNVYLNKIEEEKDKATDRKQWMEKIYKYSIDELKYVVNTFPNYTLHDEVHVLNVLDAIAGILGSDIDKLSSGECELLIAASAMHDLGMVYRDETDKNKTLQNKRFANPYLQKYHPELLGVDYSEWDKSIQQDVLRYAHPFRVDDVIRSNSAWDEVFKPDLPVCVSRTDIIAVCEAHGQEPTEFIELLASLKSDANNIDYLFCAFLLRLADLLDFDDSRAPSVLINYSKDNNKSIEEWQKHKFSRGFSYPSAPSEDDLPYSATSTDPNLEHIINNFLNWIDDELLNCLRYKRFFSKKWRDFYFPSKIKREIKPAGYLSGEFSLTMDHDKVLELLSGSNLYDLELVFIRELLQNSIDAIQLRSTVDSTFSTEDGRIDLWDWYDENGDRWFRIDDNGTGMTLGIIKRYFLKVGNSYYKSKELLRNIYRHTKNADLEYQGISQFGIGFLSCFLCGSNIEVSTLYFNDDISELETGKKSYNGYGIRLSIPQLKGYYTVRCQSEKNHCSPMKSHHFDKLKEEEYRQKPGTSILLRLDKEKTERYDIKKFVNNLVLGTNFPVYFNNVKIGLTKNELIELIKNYEGLHEYELSYEQKEEFVKTYPMLQGKYPRLFSLTYMLSEEISSCWENCFCLASHIVVDTNSLKWNYKDNTYGFMVDSIKQLKGSNTWIIVLGVTRNEFRQSFWKNRYHESMFDKDDLKKLFDLFDGLENCPKSSRSLGKAWEPFEGQTTLSDMWSYYIESKNAFPDTFSFSISDERLMRLIDLIPYNGFSCYYNGIQMGESQKDYRFMRSLDSACAILEGKWRPAVDLSRKSIYSMPFEIVFGLNILSYKTVALDPYTGFERIKPKCSPIWMDLCQSEWISFLDSEYGHWALSELSENKKGLNILQALDKYKNYNWDIFEPLSLCAISYFSSTYELRADLPAKKLYVIPRNTSFEFGDIPPHLFSHSANSETKKHIRHKLSKSLYGQKYIYNLDHDVLKWIIGNRHILKNHFSRYFKRILGSIIFSSSEYIIDSVNDLFKYIISLPESQRHGLEISSFRELNHSDFDNTETLGFDIVNVNNEGV